MRFKSAVPMVFGSPLTLATYVFVVVTGCTFQFMGPVFLYFFKTFRTIGLGVSVRLPIVLG